MKLLSINVSKPKEITYKGKQILTGIFKEPTQSSLNTAHIKFGWR